MDIKQKTERALGKRTESKTNTEAGKEFNKEINERDDHRKTNRINENTRTDLRAHREEKKEQHARRILRVNGDGSIAEDQDQIKEAYIQFYEHLKH